MRPLRLLLATTLCAGAVFLTPGCRSISGITPLVADESATMVRAEATVPIAQEMTAPGAQRRTLPWDSVVLRSTAPLGGDPDAEAGYVLVGSSPGLEAARAILRARSVALADIAARLGGLPASEPAPGETVRPSVTDFSARRSGVEQKIRTILEDQSQQRVVTDEQRGALLLVELSLGPIAEVVLDAGGGFSSSDPVAERFGARARAQEQALAQVRSGLAQELLDKPIRGEITFRRWMAADPMAPAKIEKAMQEARVIRSEEVTGDAGAKSWFALMEFDYTTLRSLAAKELAKMESERREAAKQSGGDNAPK